MTTTMEQPTINVIRSTMPKLGRKCRQCGVTLLEVLIAVVVLSIGLLGMAALQSSAISLNHSAYLRTQAINLSYDMSDRLRVNRIAALQGEYDHEMGKAPPSGDTVAKQDLREWLKALEVTLPSGKGAIQRNGNIFTITVRWDDSRGAEDPEEFVMVTQL